jgi:hypothetical protein
VTAELIEELRSARAHLRRVADGLGGEREFGPRLAIVNPPRWEVGHVGWFQEWWCLRDAREDRASLLANADRLYDSAKVAHATRWALPLPSFPDTLAYRDEVTERLIARIKEGDADPYFVQLAVRHEDMHAEAFHYTRQTLSYPEPEGAQPAIAESAAGDIEYAGGIFRLGSRPGEGFVFDNEKWSHPVVLQPFRMSRGCVTNAQYEAFVGAGGTAPRYWKGKHQRRFDRWVERAPEEPVMTRELARSAGVLPVRQAAPADRSRMGARGAARPGKHGPGVGVDRERLPALSGVRARPVQGILRALVRHPQSAARGQLRDAGAHRARALSQLLHPDRADIFAGFRTCAV